MSKENDAFHFQKYRARKRGIPFELTFEQWSNWWRINLGANWFNLRGKRRGQYVMSRFGDKGPYRLDNIKCILATENCREVYHPSSSGSKIGVEIVKDIYQSDKCLAELSQEYKIGYHTVYDIRRGRCWKRETNKLSRGATCPCSSKGISCVKGYTRFKVSTNEI